MWEAADLYRILIIRHKKRAREIKSENQNDKKATFLAHWLFHTWSEDGLIRELRVAVFDVFGPQFGGVGANLVVRDFKRVVQQIDAVLTFSDFRVFADPLVLLKFSWYYRHSRLV